MTDPSLELVVDALDAGVAEAPPAGLRSRVLDAARDARPPGRAAGSVRIGPVEAFRRTVAELDELLESLVGVEWDLLIPAYGWTVQGIVAHLSVIDRHLATRLGADDLAVPAELESDHLGMTRAQVAAEAGRDPLATLADWRAGAARLDGALDTLGDDDLAADLAFHGIPFHVDSLLVARVFEVWTHSDDIRRATGRPLGSLDAERLSLMTDLAVGALGFGMLLAGFDGAGHTARVVLTGPGGSTWTQPLALDGQPSAIDVSIVTDALSFCRLAAQRITPAELSVTITGDRELAQRVLVGAAMFAA